ncbi:TPA: hypothetical protein NJ811_004433 [Vibrio parahaemolyticus]|nr:hypothetical protein [Vibrio parahaemolyticus]HCG9630877.1 hypothetical protein [Vibrio parahaemolyticus]HCH3558127.1 hypothetical protein [Vibrio parahaemolyticus]
MAQGILVRSAQWLEDNILIYAQQFGPLLVAFSSVWIGLWWSDALEGSKHLAENESEISYWMSFPVIWVSGISASFAAFGAIVGSRNEKNRQKEVGELQTKIERLDEEKNQLGNKYEDAAQSLAEIRMEYQQTLFEMTHSYLGYLANDIFNLSNDERISLYVFDNDQFIIVGRYSKHPTYKELNRLKLPCDEGCVSKAWFEGGEVFKTLPSNHKDYVDEITKEFGIPRKRVKDFRMKSRTYYARAIENNRKRVGVIVFESTKQNNLVQDTLRDEVVKQENYICEMMEKARLVNSIVLYQGDA